MDFIRNDDENSKQLYNVDGRSLENHIFHVLAVDDSLIDRKLLERLLTVSSYQVTCVDSGDKALEYLGLVESNIKEREIKISTTSSTMLSSKHEASKVNLIMTDYNMPGINGYDLLKRIKDSTWKNVPVIVMSSENVPSRINMCLEGGAEEFLVKPVKLSDLSKLHSHILKNAISHSANEIAAEGEKSADNDDVEYTKHAENDENCSNANRRRESLKTTPDVADRRPRVQELPVS